MAILLPTQSVVLNAYAVLIDSTPGNTAFADHRAYVAANGEAAYKAALNGIFANYSTTQLATALLANLGLGTVFTQADAEAYLNANATNRVGAMIDLAAALYSYAGTDAGIVAAQSAYMTRVGASYNYSSNVNNVESVDIDTLVTASDTFALTAGVDTKTGTDASETFDGSRTTLGANIVDSLNNADQIDGGAGTDTLFVQLTTAAGGVTTSPSSVKNIEVLSVENMGGANNAVSLVNGDNKLTTIKTANSAAAVQVTNIQSAVSAYEVSTTAANFQASVAATALAGTTDAATLKVTNVANGAANVTIDIGTTAASTGYETLSVTSAGSLAANLVTLAATNATGLATVNASGDTALTLNLDNAGAGGLTAVTKVDGSGMNAALTLTVDASNTQNMTITGGKGNDVINMGTAAASTYSNLDSIDGGDGTDRLVMSYAQANAATTAQANVKNIEVIGLIDGQNGLVTVSNFGATGLRFGANMAGGSTVNYAAGTNSLDLQSFTGGGADLAVNVAGVAANDVLNITVGNATAGTGNTFSANSDVTINGAETVNILSAGGANAFAGNAAGFVLTDTAATQAIVITGSQNIQFGTVRADSINASGMTGTATLTIAGTGTTATTITGTANQDNVTGSTAGDIIDGAAGADTIANAVNGTAAAAGDVLTGGAGFDTFILRGDQASAAGGLLGQYGTVANITDFTVGSTATTTDILQLSATIGNYGGGSAFFAGVSGAEAAGTTAIQTVAQNAAATAIVNGTDMLKLTTGVATVGLTAQQAFAAAIGTGSVTGLTAGDDIFVSFYDTTNSKMVIGLVDAGAANTTVSSADTVTIVGSIAMTSADYAAFSAANLSLIAA